MKKTLITVAAVAATVSVAYATEWFNGGVGGEATGGNWQYPLPTGVSLGSSSYTLSDVDAFAFEASDPKSVSASQNLNFTSSVKFQHAYDELPAIDSGDKAGVIAFGKEAPTYYVLAKDAVGGTNEWVDTELHATLDKPVTVNIVISNGQDSAVFAIYKFGDSNPIAKEIVVGSSSSFQIAQYSGSGEIDSLIGQLIAMGIIVPGYRDPIPEGAALNAWLTTNSMTVEQLKSTDPQENGHTAYENCVIGINNNAKLVANATDTSATVATFGLDSTPLEGVGIQYKLMKKAPADAEALQVGDASASPSFEQAVGDGLYHISAEIALSPSGTKSIDSEKVGVMQVDSTKGTEYIAVPWTAFGGVEGVAPTALVKASGLSADDTLEVYDAANGDWEGYRWTGSGWTSTTDNPDVTTLTRGTAVKLTRSTPANKVYLVGGASEGAVETALQADKWNLVANPGFGKFTIGSEKLGTSTKDKVMVAADSVFTQYTYRATDGWAKLVPVVNGEIQTTTRVKADLDVPQGTGFFFVNQSGKGTINW